MRHDEQFIFRELIVLGLRFFQGPGIDCRRRQATLQTVLDFGQQVVGKLLGALIFNIAVVMDILTPAAFRLAT